MERAIDVFATLVLLFVVAVQTWTLFDKVEARAPTTCSPSICGCRPGRSSCWPGSATCRRCMLIAVRTYRLIFHPELLSKPDAIKPVE